MDDKPTMRVWLVGGFLVLALIIAVNATMNSGPKPYTETEPAAGNTVNQTGIPTEEKPGGPVRQ